MKRLLTVLQYVCIVLAFAVQVYLFYDSVHSKKEKPVKLPVIHKPTPKPFYV